MKPKNNLENLCPFSSICKYYKKGKAYNFEQYQYCEEYQKFMRRDFKQEEKEE